MVEEELSKDSKIMKDEEIKEGHEEVKGVIEETIGDKLEVKEII
jgi:hypothetical protein